MTVAGTGLRNQIVRARCERIIGNPKTTQAARIRLLTKAAKGIMRMESGELTKGS